MRRKNQSRFSSAKLLENPKDFKITKISDKETMFEFGEIITTDLAEAISIMIRDQDCINQGLWKTKVTENFEKIEPRRALYWLSGGDVEWLTLENYKKNWFECEWDFQEEFGMTLMDILQKSKTYDDIRKGFIKKLNLTTLYEFALKKNIAR